MKFPCPECERTLAPDVDWEYCPYCGSLLHHASRVSEWRELAVYNSFGLASFVSDELLRRGLPVRVRAESPAIDSVASSVEFISGGRPYHALDVSADSLEEATSALVEIERAWHDDVVEEDAPLHPLVEKSANYLLATAVVVVIGFLLLGILFGVATWVNPDL